MMAKIQNFIESKIFRNSIVFLIVFNGITMGMETSQNIMDAYGHWIHLSNVFVLSVFVVEIVLRIAVYRIQFFKDPWNLFDFFVVSVSIAPSIAGFEVLRILRVLRLFRLVTVIPQMRKIVMALIGVIPGIASIAAVLLLFFYIFAIMAVQLFGTTFPEWFGNMGKALYTLFQIMTLESWSMGIVRPIMEVHPYAWVFFVFFILIATFVMINLVIAVVVEAMNEIKEDEKKTILKEVKTGSEVSHVEMQEIREEILEIKRLLLERK